MIEINKRPINQSTSPYIIAELSANHNGSIEIAKQTIMQAKECGAHAVKLQTYTADSMTINCDKDDFRIRGGLWDGYTLYNLYKEACTPYEWHGELFKFAKDIGITIFSTPFDEDAVDLLESLNTPAYKIASFELTDLDLIQYAASKGKPILISTGLSKISEIENAINACFKVGNNNILLFHCISSYPTPTEEANVKMVSFLRNKFNLEVGLSDHTLNNIAAISAISLGATAIEKHFILDKENKGPDSDFSINPAELKSLIKDSKKCWESLGVENFKRSSDELKNQIFRRSLYFVEDLQKNEIIKPNHIKKIRPGYGLSPKFFNQIINKKTKQNVKRGDRVTWEVINKD